MWLYCNVEKRDGKTKWETTEHSIRVDESVINPLSFYGRKMIVNSQEYEFDRFDLSGSSIFIRNDTGPISAQ